MDRIDFGVSVQTAILSGIERRRGIDGGTAATYHYVLPLKSQNHNFLPEEEENCPYIIFSGWEFSFTVRKEIGCVFSFIYSESNELKLNELDINLYYQETNFNMNMRRYIN